MASNRQRPVAPRSSSSKKRRLKIDRSLWAQEEKPPQLADVDDETWKCLNIQARFPRDRFDWLGLDPNASLSSSYSPFFDLPATTFDFGCDGYTASCNIGGELLQLTAPYEGCGFVSVKGDFDDSLDSILARAQRPQGGKATFGIKFVDPPAVDPNQHARLGTLIERGTFNHRWPFSRFTIERNGEQIGRCSIFSCIRDGTLYQIVRLDGEIITLSDRSVTLLRRKAAEEDPAGDRVVLEFGGTFRFDCLCGGLRKDDLTAEWDDKGCAGYVTSPSLPNRALAMELFVMDEATITGFEELLADEDDQGFEKFQKFDRSDFPPGQREYLEKHYKQERKMTTNLPEVRETSQSNGDAKAVNGLAIDEKLSEQSSVQSKGERVNLTTTKDIYLKKGSLSIIVATFTITNTDTNTNDEIQISQGKDQTVVATNDEPDEPPSSEEFYDLVGIEDRFIHDMAYNFDKSRTAGPSDSPWRTNMNATNLLWKEIYLSKVVGVDPKSSLEEICLVARTLEKVMGPSHVPVVVEGGRHVSSPVNTLCLRSCVTYQELFWQIRFLIKTRNLLGTLALNDKDHIRGIAIERCRSIFEHIEKLVTYLIVQFAGHGAGSGPRPPKRPIMARRDEGYYSGRDVVHEVKHQKVIDEFDQYYVTIIIWYVMAQCPEAVDKCLVGKLKEEMVKHFPRDEALVGKGNVIKTHILRWYHHEAVAHMSIEVRNHHSSGSLPSRDSYLDEIDPGSSSNDHQDEAWDEDEFEQRETRIIKWRLASQRSLTTKIATRDPYTEEDEQCDRLLLLARRELKWADSDYCTSMVHTRILDRARTTTLNPGTLPVDLDGSFPISKSAPWELNALCHHIRLFICLHRDRDSDKQDDDKIDQYRKRCLLFMSSDGSMVATWERSNAAALHGWFTMETSCVIATSLVDILQRLCNEAAGTRRSMRASMVSGQTKDLSLAPPSDEATDQPPAPLRAGSTMSVASGDTLESDEHLQDADDVQKATLNRLSELLEAFRAANKSSRPYSWKAYQPTAPYHLQSFFNSLDDSPSLFKATETRRVQMRDNLRRWLNMGKRFNESLEWVAADMETLFPIEEIGMLSVIDLKIDTDVAALEGAGQANAASNPFVTGRIVPYRDLWGDAYSILRIDVIQHEEMLEKIKNTPELGVYNNDELAARTFYDLVDYCQLRRCIGYRFRPELVRFYESLDESDRDIIKDVGRHAWNKIQKNLLGLLTDSLVDQQVQYRIYFLQSCRKPVIQALAYVWHTEALDALDDQFGDCCHFSSVNKATWYTKITLLYWTVRPRPGSGSASSSWDEEPSIWTTLSNAIKRPARIRDAERQGTALYFAGPNRNDEGRTLSAQFPPDFLGQKKVPAELSAARRLRQHLDSLGSVAVSRYEVEDRATTLVMSSNGLGDFAKGTVVSRVVGDEEMMGFARTAAEIWRAFVHQPQTTRCLLFVVLLGLTCEGLAREYEKILDVLIKELRLNIGVLDDTLRWTDSDQVIVYLKQSLWALKALQLFHDTMSESLNKIGEARSEMVAQVNMGPGRRHEVLEQMCQSYIDDFDRQHSRLVNMSVRYQHQIEHITRFRDGISSVSSLEDGQTARRQDNNLQILTWITTGYLPLGFVAALFAVPDTQQVISDSLGTRWFVIMIMIFWLSTLIVANILDRIFTWLRGFRAAGNSLWDLAKRATPRNGERGGRRDDDDGNPYDE